MDVGRNLVSSLDEIEVVVVGVEESHWRHLMVVYVGVDGFDQHHWTCVDG